MKDIDDAFNLSVLKMQAWPLRAYRNERLPRERVKLAKSLEVRSRHSRQMETARIHSAVSYKVSKRGGRDGSSL